MELIVEHERGSGRARAQAMASEERDLIDFFRRAEIDYEAHLSSQVTRVALVRVWNSRVPACTSQLLL